MPKDPTPELVYLLKFAIKLMAEQENISINQAIDTAITLIKPDAKNKQQIIDTLEQIRNDFNRKE